MIFQRFTLLQQRTCQHHIRFPKELAGVSRKAAQSRARELLELVGLPDKAQAYPAQQRFGLRLGVLLFGAQCLTWRQQNIFHHRHMGEPLVALEHHPDAPP